MLSLRGVSEGGAAQAAEAVRHTFNSFLNGPTIETVRGTPPVAKTFKTKADGEDLLTTLVERAADFIATAVKR